MAKKTVAERLKGLRELAGLPQFALASRTGINRAVISGIENGHIVPRPDQASGIERACRKALVDAAAEIQRRSKAVDVELAKVS